LFGFPENAVCYPASHVYAQQDRQMAGFLAGQMFALVGYLGMLCGIYLLIPRFTVSGRESFRKMLHQCASFTNSLPNTLQSCPEVV
jgi:hypothetical protein